MNERAAIEIFREKVREVIDDPALRDTEVKVRIKPLTPQEAIGNPLRRDYPIIEGKERVIEATILGSRGQAFTDSPANYTGRLDEVMSMELSDSSDRAVFLAAANAVLAHLGLAKGTVHCRDEAPEECAKEMAETARRRGVKSVGLIGLNPAIAEALVKEFGAGCVSITDLNPDNIGRDRFGVMVGNGKKDLAGLIDRSDLVVITGTTLANGTYDGILRLVRTSGKEQVLYGITAAGFCVVMGVERWCFRAREGSCGDNSVC